jgi:1,4-alpha-glucan branching enzyme
MTKKKEIALESAAIKKSKPLVKEKKSTSLGQAKAKKGSAKVEIKEVKSPKKVVAKELKSPKKVAAKKVVSSKMVAPKKVKEVLQVTIDASFSLFSDFDIFLFKQGKHYKLFEKFGAHQHEVDGKEGCYFAVWAPSASHAAVIGNFNGWNSNQHQMNQRSDGSGIWEIFIEGINQGEVYKYFFINAQTGEKLEKFDPYAMYAEVPPKTASVVYDIDYKWNDLDWMQTRKNKNLQSPISVYEIHFGSWRRVPEEDNRPLTYREMATWLVPYIKETGFTHVEFLPLTEHPFYGSWGYQTVGYFSPTSRYGSPQDLMYLIEQLHLNDIGVILDWVPSHFPMDSFALSNFDGTCLYEHSDPRKGYHPDWKSSIFNYGRFEVRSFLISSALFWLEKYHIDGLRVDAVASMLYLDYSRKQGEWIPNENGGNENLEAVSFLKELNEQVYLNFPDVHTIAEESTAWPMVSRPTAMGGLGFGMKWMMGWMNDSLDYFSKNPIYREFHQGQLSFSLHYAFNENFVLPLSHDEVVHGKGALINKMPGNDWEKFANLRLLYTYMFTHPGAKLLFMGCEFGQYREWNHESSLDWHVLENPFNKGLKKLVSQLNQLYKNETALYHFNFSKEGFEWIDYNDAHNSVFSYIRKDKEGNELIIVGNFTPIVRNNYKVGVNQHAVYTEIFNSDDKAFEGSGLNNANEISAKKGSQHGRPYILEIDLPPLAMIVLKAINKIN